MERVTEIFVLLDNKPSTLGNLCAYLAEEEINIESIGVFQDTAKIFVMNLNKAVKALSKREEYADHELRDVLLVDLENSLLGETCPDCGQTISFEEGCMTCHFCGFSKCG